MSIRLNKAIRELNIGLQTAVEFLMKKSGMGEDKLELTSKISDEQYEALKEAFQQHEKRRQNEQKSSTELLRPILQPDADAVPSSAA